MERPVTEIWVDLYRQLKWTRWIALGMAILCVLSWLMMTKLWHNKVIVVRVDEGKAGQSSWHDPSSKLPGEEEVISFTEEFLQAYLAPNSATVQKNFSRAAAMMGETLRSQHLKVSTDNNYVQKIKNMQIATDLSFKNMVVEREGGGINVFAKGRQRTLNNRKIAVFHEFQVLVQLKEIARSKENPYGLEVGYVDFEIKSAS